METIEFQTKLKNKKTVVVIANISTNHPIDFDEAGVEWLKAFYIYEDNDLLEDISREDVRENFTELETEALQKFWDRVSS